MQAPELTLHEGTHLMREAIKEADEGRHQWPSQLTLAKIRQDSSKAQPQTRARSHGACVQVAISGALEVVDESGHQCPSVAISGHQWRARSHCA